FDPQCQEGDYENRCQGVMDGYNTCVVSALATAWAESSQYKYMNDAAVPIDQVLDFPKATRIGLEMARLLHRNGYDPADIKDEKRILTFPYKKLEERYYSYWQPITSSAMTALTDSLLDEPPASLKNAKDRPFRDSDLAIYRMKRSVHLNEPLYPSLSIL